MNEISYLIAAEVLKYLKLKRISIQTPLAKTRGKKLSKSVVIVPILRAGLGLVEGFVKFLPDVEKGHIGLYRDEQTYKPIEYLCRLPKPTNKIFIILDPMLATGNSSIAAVKILINFTLGGGCKFVGPLINVTLAVSYTHLTLPTKA